MAFIRVLISVLASSLCPWSPSVCRIPFNMADAYSLGLEDTVYWVVCPSDKVLLHAPTQGRGR